MAFWGFILNYKFSYIEIKSIINPVLKKIPSTFKQINSSPFKLMITNLY